MGGLLPSLVGPTASGKTEVAIEVAGLVGAEIVSADSRQIYRAMDIGTAKPTAAELAAAPHHLVGVADPSDVYTAGRFGEEARTAFEDVRGRGKLPLLVGGSGLYLRAAEEGLFDGPPADPELRARLAAEADEHGDAALHERLRAVDPETGRRVSPRDRVRVIRALEVHELTGTPLSVHHRRHRDEERSDTPLRFGLAWRPDALAARIERRVDAMLEAGFAREVESLLASGVPDDAPSMKAVGYPEMLDFVRGEIDEDEVRQRIVVATRQFAKRQRTWFRAVPGVTWVPVREGDDLAAAAEQVAMKIATER